MLHLCLCACTYRIRCVEDLSEFDELAWKRLSKLPAAVESKLRNAASMRHAHQNETTRIHYTTCAITVVVVYVDPSSAWLRMAHITIIIPSSVRVLMLTCILLHVFSCRLSSRLAVVGFSRHCHRARVLVQVRERSQRYSRSWRHTARHWYTSAHIATVHGCTEMVPCYCSFIT